MSCKEKVLLLETKFILPDSYLIEKVDKKNDTNKERLKHYLERITLNPFYCLSM